MIILNQSINMIENYASWIQIALSFVLKLKMFIRALKMMLRKDLIHQIMKSIDRCECEKIKESLD